MKTYQSPSSPGFLAQQTELQNPNQYQDNVSKPFNAALFKFAEDGELVSVLSRDSSKDGSQTSGVLALQGPSGKGEHQLVRLDNSDLDSGIGSVTGYTAWSVEVSSETAQPHLNYAGVTKAGHWIAVPANGSDNLSDDSIVDWELWWYSPSGANVEDFPVYVMVNLEPVVAATVKESEYESVE